MKSVFCCRIPWDVDLGVLSSDGLTHYVLSGGADLDLAFLVLLLHIPLLTLLLYVFHECRCRGILNVRSLHKLHISDSMLHRTDSHRLEAYLAEEKGAKNSAERWAESKGQHRLDKQTYIV